MNAPWYDAIEDLAGRIQRGGLAGLREIEFERHQAGYKRSERMACWCVLGRFVLDACGNFGRITEPTDRICKHKSLADLDDEKGFLARNGGADPYYIMTLDAANAIAGSVTWTPAGLPQTSCDRCGRAWTLDTVHNARSIRGHGDSWIWRHAACEHMRQIQDGMVWINKILSASAFAGATMRLIQNEYWPPAPGQGYPSAPWCIIETRFGEIRMGPRKRVIHIDWENARGLAHVRGAEIVEGEGTTHGEHMVHCYGGDRASIALTRLFEKASATAVSP